MIGIGISVSQQRGRGIQAAFGLSLTGVGGGAVIGTEASIGYTITPDNGTDTAKWSASSNPADAATYGTGANPTSLAGMEGFTLYLHVTDGGETITRATVIQAAAGDTTAPVLSAIVVDEVAGTISITSDEAGTAYWQVDDAASYTDTDAMLLTTGSSLASGSYALEAGGNSDGIVLTGAEGSHIFHFGVIDAAGNASLVESVAITVGAAATTLVNYDFTTDETANPEFIAGGVLTKTAEVAKTFAFSTSGELTGAMYASGNDGFEEFEHVLTGLTAGNSYTLEVAGTAEKASGTGISLEMVWQFTNAALEITLAQTIRAYSSYTTQIENQIVDNTYTFTCPAGCDRMRTRWYASAYLAGAVKLRFYKIIITDNGVA